MNNTRGEKKLSEWYKGKQLGADLKASMLCLVKKLNSNFQCYSNSSDIFIITIVITMTIIIINTYIKFNCRTVPFQPIILLFSHYT